MKIPNRKMKLGALALAAQGLAVAMQAAHAQVPTASLRVPPNFAEFGLINVSKDSAKFGEYTGLNKSGIYPNANFDIRGGNAYTDPGGTTRWQVYGSDLGLTSRSAGGTIAEQGRWNFGLNFDQLTHYTSDSYQTPYTGTMGGNTFSLPSFGLAANTRTLSAAQLSQFQTMNISNDRQNTSLTGGLVINRQWNLKVDFNELAQSGARLMGFGAAAIGGATGERISILPMPLNYKTDTVTVAANWVGEKGNATLSYYGSFFRDRDNGVRFQTWAGALTTETVGTAPSNDLHQVNLTGGYALTDRTKVAGGLSYSYNSQNTAYAYDTAQMSTPSPTSSLNGSVRNTHADLKITDRTTRDLTLTGGVKYDQRDNRTSSNIYNFFAIDGSANNRANYPNAPLSIKKSQLELAGDYRLDPKQKVRLAYNHDDTQRECSQYATGGGTPPYAPGTNCVTIPKTKEDKIGAAYRYKAFDGMNLNAGYSYADRKSDRDLNARPPMIGRDGNPTAAGIAAAPPGITGLNGGEFIGFNPFFEASRRQNMFKAGANWEPTEQLSLGFSGRATLDDYGTTYGMQKGQSWGLNVDGTYRYHESGTVTLYATQQQRRRDMTNDQRSPLSAPVAATATAVAIPSGATWTNHLKDTDTTLGLNVKHGGLMGGRLELVGDTTYSLAKTSYSTVLNYSTTTTGGLTCSDPSIYTCVPLPDISNTLFQFKLTGLYDVTKTSKVSLGWLYQRLRSDDFYYNGLQNGFTPTSVLPTNQTAPSYAVNVVFASYIVSF